MTSQEHEQADGELLSALMDGELSGAEQAHALERLQVEPALQRRWARYHAARAALAMGAARLSPEFSAHVAEARTQQPAVLAPAGSRASRQDWRRPLAGLAIAASVALVAFAALTVLRGPALDRPPVQVADNVSTAIGLDGGTGHGADAITPIAVPAAAGASEAERARLRQRLLLYLVSHSEFADAGQMPTVIQYGRLSGLNAGQ